MKKHISIRLREWIFEALQEMVKEENEAKEYWMSPATITSVITKLLADSIRSKRGL